MGNWLQQIRNLREKTISNGVELAGSRKELYQGVAGEALDLAGVCRTNVRLVDQDKRQLRFISWAGQGWDQEKRSYVYSLDNPGMGAQVVELRRAIYLTNAKTSTQYVPLFEDVMSEYCAPIKLRKRVVALLTVNSLSPNGIKPPIQAAIDNLARECGQILEYFELQEESWILSLLDDLSGRDDLNDVCETAVERIRSIFGVAMVSLLLYEPLRDILQLQAFTRKPRLSKTQTYRLGEGLTGWVARHRKILRVRDYRHQEELSSIHPELKRSSLGDYEPPEGHPAAYLGAPLLNRDDLVGVIRLSNKIDHGDFVLEEEALLKQIAKHLALHIATMQEIDTKAKIVELSQDLSSHLRLKEAGAIIARSISEITGAYCVVIRLWEGERRKLIAAYPEDAGLPEYLEASDPFPPGFARQKEEPVFSPDSSSFDLWNLTRSQFPVLAEAQSFAYLPLKADLLRGTVSLFWKGVVNFHDERRHSITSLAGLAAISIEASRRSQETIDEAKLSTEVIDDLLNVGVEFSQTRELKDLYQRILANAKRIAGVDVGTFREVDADRLIGKATDGVEERTIVDNPLPIKALSVMRQALESGQPTLVSNLKTKEYLDLIEHSPSKPYRDMLLPIKSMILVPIKLQGVPLAMVFLDSQQKLALPEQKRKYLEILAGYAAIAIDGARLHAAKEKRLQLAEPLALLGQVLDGYLHVVGSPLQSLSAAVDAIGHRDFDIKKLPAKLDGIRRYLKGLKNTVEDLKLLAQTRSGSDEDFNLVEAVNVFCDAHPWPDHIKAICDPNPRSSLVTGNKGQIKVAWGMVVQNAVQAIPEQTGGSVTIATGGEDSEPWIAVIDTGIGMKEEVRKRCLETFFTTKEDVGGSGLGLAIANAVMTKHGGRIAIESEPGQGTEVKLIFPQKTKENRGNV